MRKITFWLFLGILMLILLGVTAGLALAELAPFHPGDAGFAFQQQAEQIMVDLTPDAAARVQTLLDLLERRASDLELGAASPQALAPFDRAYAAALAALAAAPAQNSADLRARALHVYNRLCETLQRVAEAHNDKTDLLLQRWVQVDLSIQVLSDLGRPVSDLLPGPTAAPPAAAAPARGDAIPHQATTVVESHAVDPHLVEFPPGSSGAQHAFYPLTGKHAALACAGCHSGGTYAGVPTTCAACHASQLPADHFPGDCSLCHSPAAWKPAHFSHADALAGDCAACHHSNKPAKHFDGQCALCHATTAWKPAHFEHTAAGAANCNTCHQPDRPADHFVGQCSLCHATNGWKPAHFNHAASGAANCAGCHEINRPANHFAGQCSLCHTAKAWMPASFNHAALKAIDCQACHAAARPANHFTGQCSLCHTPAAWKPASFNHSTAAAGDCQSCHAAVKPANHFAGQCSLCHNPAAWKPASFNHTVAAASDCQSCHLSIRPANHNPQPCTNCHTTKAWLPVTFNHTFPLSHGGAASRCAACHADNGSGAPNCFLCHIKAQLDQKHAAILNYATRCLTCHPGGLR